MGVTIISHDLSLAHHIGKVAIGRVVVGKRAFVGAGAIILPGTSIGEDSVVAAGAVVHGEVPPRSLVVGNPAKVSDLKGTVAWHRVNAARSPNWPREGSYMDTGITEARKREQREELAGAVLAYVPVRSAPGSPYALRNEHQPTSVPERVASAS
jgi:hypothetical protein